MENLLHGLTILVTRPKPQGEMLCEHIRTEGGKAIYFPTIEILPPNDTTLCHQQISHLAQYDWLIFLSPQAVFHSAKMLHTLWPQFPGRLRVAAVGGGTMQALKEMNIPAHVFPVADWRSEGLADLDEFQNINGKKIALICGEGGREWLATTLAARGAEVTRILVYRRALPKVNIERYIHLFQAHEIDIIICTSSEIMRNLKTLLGETIWSEFRAVPILVISERLARYAKTLEFQTVLLAANASLDAMMTILAKKKDLLCQMKKVKK
jgi:uroporphyrinogen-III synthase